MTSRHSMLYGDTIEYSGWLIIDSQGGMKLSRPPPRLAAGERALSLVVKVPKTLFKTPSLKATITIPPDTSPPEISAETVAGIENALKIGTGMEFSVTVGNV